MKAKILSFPAAPIRDHTPLRTIERLMAALERIRSADSPQERTAGRRELETVLAAHEKAKRRTEQDLSRRDQHLLPAPVFVRDEKGPPQAAVPTR